MQPALDLSPQNWMFAGLKFMEYGCILADPGWLFENWSAAGEKKNPNQHYHCDPTTAIAAWPLWTIAAKDSWIVMWGTGPMLSDAFVVLSAWGYRFVTAGGWAKQSSTGNKMQFGPGYVRRSRLEFYLIGKRGEPQLKPGARKISNLISAPVRQHSRKPDKMYDEIEQSFEGPYCELNSRSSRPGWDSWGHDVGKFDRES